MGKWEYQVALSFAGEQRAYVEEVSDELTRLGIRHFYDNKEQAVLWGKPLTRYLDDIYFEKSQYVVVFVSKEYRDKIWTKWEMNSAQDRALRESQEYILPVYFDDTRLSGLVGSLGHINARTTSPKQLAQLICDKITGNASTPIISSVKLPRYHAPVLPRIDFHQAEEEYLRNIHYQLKKSTVAVIFGEKGIGKRTVVNSFLNGKDCVVRVGPNRSPHYQFEPLIEALGDNRAFFANTDDLMLPERLKRHILSLCQNCPHILYFEGMDQYESGLFAFLLELCNEILEHHPEYKTLIIFEYDSDSEFGNNLKKQFNMLPPGSLEFIPFQRLQSEALYTYMQKTFGDIEIDSSDMEYILKSAHGNIMYLNIILNYLRMKGTLQKTLDHFVCSHIVEGTLIDALGEYIRQRYENLDDNLKEVLTKSAVIGNTFSSDLLSKPFGILHAEELLDKIESLSLLIKRESETVYSFESPDSFRIISDAIRPEERRQWHSILAKYFERRLERLRNTPLSNQLDQDIILLCSITRHYKYAMDYSRAAVYFYELAKKYRAISDYENAFKAISEAKSMLDLTAREDITVQDLECRISVLEAECFSDTGEYSKSLPLYLSYVSQHCGSESKDENLSITLDYALCSYMDGKTTSAIALAEQVKEQLQSEGSDSLLYCKALSLLASIDDCTGKLKEKQKYYVQALSICRDKGYEYDYYRMLKKASMVYDEAIAINMYPAAEAYFEKHHQIKNMAELQHNVATDYLYLNERERILPPLIKSQGLFESFGSTMIHYPLNTMGIYEAVFEKDYAKAIQTFDRALSYDIECYSQVVLRTNMAVCFLKMQMVDCAKEELQKADELTSRPVNSDVFDYQIYHFLGWGLFNYYRGNYKECLRLLTQCVKLPNIDPRFSYICKYLIYLAKKHKGMLAHSPRETPCKPILNTYFEMEAFFLTLRFFE